MERTVHNPQKTDKLSQNTKTTFNKNILVYTTQQQGRWGGLNRDLIEQPLTYISSTNPKRKIPLQN